MSILDFQKPDRICIVRQDGTIVQLNDTKRTWMRFNASERAKARRICASLNQANPFQRPGFEKYRVIPLIEQ